MRTIIKGPEPTGFAAWKAKASPNWQPSWNNLQNPEKQAVLRALAQEQGFICCYCERRIRLGSTPQDCHIEHLIPRFVRISLALEYGNLLASCQGELPPAPRQCGHRKDQQTIPVDPLMPGCAAYFDFDSSGGIRPATGTPGHTGAAQVTIDRLGLDVPHLQEMRRQAILAFSDLFESPDDTALREALDSCTGESLVGEHLPFTTAVRSVLSKYLRPPSAPPGATP